ncbi:hypothetical protein LSAT2_011662 [Lamellibrachia satsuma]|nr:hypothetical protein LSAT2_011662 [Lamellibrachia satsuma]
MSATTNATKAEYARGDLIVAYVLLRSPVETTPSSSVAEDVKLHVQIVESSLPMSPQRTTELRSCTKDDATLQTAIIHTLTGWPRYERVYRKA